MGKLRLREVKWFTQSHTASKFWSYDLDLAFAFNHSVTLLWS